MYASGEPVSWRLSHVIRKAVTDADSRLRACNAIRDVVSAVFFPLPANTDTRKYVKSWIVMLKSERSAHSRAYTTGTTNFSDFCPYQSFALITKL